MHKLNIHLDFMISLQGTEMWPELEKQYAHMAHIKFKYKHLFHAAS